MKSKTLYQSRKEFYTDPVNGSFNRIRLCTMSFVTLFFFILPWINWNNHQALLFDISYNRVYFFWAVFWPQDFVLIALFCIFCIISLFALTLYSGRIWCGFFCPQSIWIKMSMFLTRILEGKRNNRFKFDQANISFYKICIIFLKHFFWIILSGFTAFTFIGYFIPIKWLFASFFSFDVFYTSFFWILFFLFLTYFNIGWFKEQFCFLVCPYARLQSVMFDENTLIVSYDNIRGEKRGSRNKSFKYRDFGLGDCIDCKKCVTCCPTGIDIRDGLQMECISCGACVDACNEVMYKMGYEQNLISFKKEAASVNYKYSKIKLFLYSVVLFILIFLISYFLITRSLVYFDVTRCQYQLFNITKENFIENNFFLKIINKSDKENTYFVSIEPPLFDIIGAQKIVLNSSETQILNIILKLKNKNKEGIFIDVCFSISNLNNKEIIKKQSKFILPFGDF